MHSYITHIPLISRCLSVLLALAMASCITDNMECPDDTDTDTGDGITLEFAMLTRNAMSSSSRALISPGGNTEIGFGPENYLDLDNLLFLLFDKDQKLIRVFKPDVKVENDAGAGEYVKYLVRVFLNDDYFLKATDPNITFTIVVLGNYSTLDPKGFAYHVGQKLEDIFKSDAVATFAMPVIENGSWIPRIFPTAEGGAAHIPMAGMQTFTAPTASLLASTLNNPYQLSTGTQSKYLNILRALAKIEIIDRIGATGTGSETTQTDKNHRSSIEKVELVGHTTRGSILPTFNQWTTNDTETQYVKSTSVPTSASYIGYQPDGNLAFTGNPINFFADAAATAARDDRCQVYSCYLTEYDPDRRGGSYPMWIRLTTRTPGNDGEAETTLYRLEVAPYTNNSPGATIPILRNNIYRYEIAGIKSDVELELKVNPWDASTTVWNYDENPALTTDGYMQWTGGDITTATAEVLYSGTTLVGTFAFDQPRGGSTWHANLIPANEYTPTDAFYFVDEDGNKMDELPSGVINGQPATIRIAATTNTTEYNRAARLVFTVSTFDGRIITATVLDPAKYGTKQYFTITQNAQ